MNDSKVTDEELNDIEQEIKNYENMKSDILNEYEVNINKVRTEVLHSIKAVKKINK